jgi:hypothetical protein
VIFPRKEPFAYYQAFGRAKGRKPIKPRIFAWRC